ncbi:helix-turn-helix domain-containing protein [Kitasatospora sp. NPDC101447]|uniref:helix-turn-helix domain-containing protein n=1 Tax=Kitasatospora sp. NPDC101447 TaxID=3364102 RepID=UPI003826CAF3
MSVETDEFAAMLRELKERSGRSYGVLATRLHVSTSTLHRYCNGAAVPAEYAPVERLARVCGAGDEELVELHRRWILADAARRRETGPKPDGARTEGAKADEAKAEGVGTEPLRGPESASAPKAAREPAPVPGPEPAPVPAMAPAPGGEVEPVHPVTPAAEPRRRTRTRVLLSAAAVAAVAVVVSTFVLRGPGGTPDAAGSPTTTATAATTAPAASSADTAAPVAAAAPTSPAGTPTGAPSPTDSSTDAPTPTGTPEDVQAPFHVNVLTDNWGSPCDQWFLSPRTPGQVTRPPDTAARTGSWAAAQHAVPAGHLRLQLTAQGTSATPVVLHAVYVHIVSTQPAPKWNAYTPGAGCGGGLTPASFAVDLDSAAPHAVPAPGSEGAKKLPVTDFPYRVSDTDPQVIDVDATTRSQDVSWYLDLVWSSGDRQGTLTVNDNGRPFRTAGLHGAPSYFHNGTAWAPSPAED